MRFRPIKTTLALASGIFLSLSYVATAVAQQPATPTQTPATSPAPETAVPDAPAPQASAPLANAAATPITPGKGSNESEDEKAPAKGASTSSAADSSPSAASGAQAPGTVPPPANTPDTFQTTAPDLAANGSGPEAVAQTFRTFTNFVEVPVTVKDSKGQLVPGLTWRDFRVFENNERQQLRLFTVDPFPLSVAFVIDQSLTSDVMAKVNDSLGAIQGALTPYDEAAVITYNNGPQERTSFTGAQSARLPAVLAFAKETGREAGVPVNSGPLAGCNVRENGSCVDPVLQQGGSAGGASVMSIPKEIHTLNDAILLAAKELSYRPQGRRRIIYVISDGKEYGSKATLKEVIKYLQTNKIAVYATGVGDSARWGEGYLSKFHIPFTMYDNILLKYTQATGGTLDSERSLNGIEKSYAKIAEEARAQYTLGYISHQPVLDDRFRSVEVRVDRPNVEVISKRGYYPSARDFR